MKLMLRELTRRYPIHLLYLVVYQWEEELEKRTQASLNLCRTSITNNWWRLRISRKSSMPVATLWKWSSNIKLRVASLWLPKVLLVLSLTIQMPLLETIKMLQMMKCKDSIISCKSQSRTWLQIWISFQDQRLQSSIFMAVKVLQQQLEARDRKYCKLVVLRKREL